MITTRRRFFATVGAALVAGAAAAIGIEAIAQPKEKVIKILARRFTFTPNQIALQRGVPVVFELTTADVLMGFNLPDFGVRADILPDKTAKVRVVPDKTGTFTFLCDIFCGSGHETMSGTITVT
jgi:cytochrome c oxidase subunit II